MAELSDKQKVWLVQVVGKPPVEQMLGPALLPAQALEGDGQSALELEAQWQAKEQKKAERLQRIRQDLADTREQIHQLMALKVTVVEGGKARQVNFFSDSKLWDPQNEFEPGHHMKNLQEDSLPPEDLAKLKAGLEKVYRLADTLTGTVQPKDFAAIYAEATEQGKPVAEIAADRLVSEDTIRRVIERQALIVQASSGQGGQPPPGGLDMPIGDEEPLFDDMEIRQEYFDPLVREKIIPDSQVEDRYNQTVQQFGGASTAYGERLQQHSAGLGDNAEMIEACQKLGLVAKSVTQAAGSLAGAVHAAAEKGSQLAENTALASQIITEIQAVSMLAVSTAQGVYEKKAAGAIDSVADVLTASMSLAGIPSEVIAGAKQAYLAGAKGIEVGIALCDPDADKSEAINLIADGLSNALGATGDKDMARIGKALGFALKQAVSAKAIYECMRKDPPAIDTVIKLITGAVTSATTAVLTDPTFEERSQAHQEAVEEDPEDQSGLQDAADEYEEGVSEAIGSIDEVMEEGSQALGKSEATKTLADLLKERYKNPEDAKKFLEDNGKAADKKLAEEINEELEKDALHLSEARLSLSADSGDESMQKLRDEFDSVDKLVEEIEKRRVYIKLAEAIFDAGVGTAAEFVSVLKIASAGKDLIKNLLIAGQRALEVVTWRSKRRDALAAASLQSFAFQKRVDNLDVQITEATARALLNMAQVIGATLSATGVATIAGEVATKAASAGSALLEIVLMAHKESELAAAWAAYQLALKNPNDRIQLREAIARNTTLAKYAMAYAALQEKDPIAIEGMSVAGLDEETLRNPSNKVDAVVKYLEVKWEQDPLCLRRVPIKDWLADKEGGLTLSAFLANKDAALNKLKMGEDVLMPGPTGGIEGALLGLDKARGDAKGAQDAYDLAGAQRGADSARVEKAMRDFDGCQALNAGAGTTVQKIRQLVDELAEDWKTPEPARADQARRHLQRLKDADPLKELRTLRPQVQALLDTAKECTGLAAYATRIDEYLDAAGQLPDKLLAVEEALAASGKQLGAFKPLKEDGSVNDKVRQYTSGLKLEAEEQLRVIAATRAKLGDDGRTLPPLRQAASDLDAKLAGITSTHGTLKTDIDKLELDVKAHLQACKVAIKGSGG